MRARARGRAGSQVLAPVSKPTPPSSRDAEPAYERWTVGKAVGPVTVYARAEHVRAGQVRSWAS